MADVFPLVTLVIPIIAVAGGIFLAIVRVLSQARLEELARKERLAAIERGVDPDKLHPLTGPEFYGLGDNRLRRAHGLFIGGMILVALGLSLGVVFATTAPDKNHWIIGIVPVFVGASLLFASRVVWPKGGDTR